MVDLVVCLVFEFGGVCYVAAFARSGFLGFPLFAYDCCLFGLCDLVV